MNTSDFDRNVRLVTSYILSPVQLGLIRTLFALYTLVTLIFVMVWEGTKTKDIDAFFSYFTNLSYIGICAYFLAAGTQTLLFVKYSRGGEHHYPLQTWPRPLRCLHIFLLSTIITFPILVTIVYWALLSSSSTFTTPYSAWTNVSKHALNTAFAFFEICVTNIEPSTWIHLFTTIVILGGYLGVAYITHATQGFYTYSFLDPSKGSKKLVIYVIGIALGQCLVFSIVNGVIYIRKSLTRRAENDAIDEKSSGSA
ncbi:hypothetical protein BDN70DRAFT_904449 [Pholiota conissans]|uniref:Uncharacterized protein n=1 Tax=Pholiota conissans TaxID=109636 RepID=A0A9P5ZAC1_9AGAR|nr:hypothetical protein BDN70DRAFT_904449 [Pholiota conissans]